MPAQQTRVGAQLNSAGRNQQVTGDMLIKSAEQVRAVSGALKQNSKLAKSLRSIEDGVRAVRALLTPISATLHTIHQALRDIKVRGIDYVRTTYDIPVIGRKTFVTGITLTWVYPLRDVSNYPKFIADRIDEIEEALDTIADAIEEFRDEFPNIRTGIRNGADSMESAGKRMVNAGKSMESAGALLGGRP